MKQKIINRDFSKNVLILMRGTTIAQALPIAVAPILTRIYTPDDFGLFALYTGIVSILAVFITARYEMAVVLPNRKSYALQMVLFVLFIALFITIILTILIIIFDNHIVHLLDKEKPGLWLYMIPVSAFLIGVYQAFYYWLNREKDFESMSHSRIVQSTGGASSQVAIGSLLSLGGVGLILGQVIGLIISVGYMSMLFFRTNNGIVKPNFAKQLALAKRYINFPKYLIAAHGMNAASRQLPNIFFNIIFSAMTAGYYLLIQRVIGIPVSIIGGSIGDVFRQQASESFNERGECRNEYIDTLKRLIFIATLPFGIFTLIAPDIFSFVFGDEWVIAGYYAQILSPMFFFQFITSPLSSIFIIVEKQHLDLLWQSLLLVSTILSLFIGYIYSDIYISLVLFSTTYSVMYIINGIMTWKFAMGDLRN